MADSKFTPFAIITNFSSIRDVGRKAEELAKKAYPSESQATRERDAYRHLVWQAMLAKQYGPDVAATIGNLHESKYIPIIGGMGQPESQREMDLYNNQLGRSIQYSSPEELDKIIQGYILSNKAKLDAEAGTY
jgi:hypothetical protein